MASGSWYTPFVGILASKVHRASGSGRSKPAQLQMYTYWLFRLFLRHTSLERSCLLKMVIFFLGLASLWQVAKPPSLSFPAVSCYSTFWGCWGGGGAGEEEAVSSNAANTSCVWLAAAGGGSTTACCGNHREVHFVARFTTPPKQVD